VDYPDDYAPGYHVILDTGPYVNPHQDSAFLGQQCGGQRSGGQTGDTGHKKA